MNMCDLTDEIKKEYLKQNEGFTKTTHYYTKVDKWDRTEKVINGRIHVYECRTKEYDMNEEDTHKFLLKYRFEMDYDEDLVIKDMEGNEKEVIYHGKTYKEG